MNNTLGVMLDCSRNSVYTVDTVKHFIDLLEKMGYNMLMLYTEDTYEVNNQPHFGYLRGRYSKEEIKEIVTYAKAHGIETIPCIQTLAHLNQIFYWREYADIRDIDDILTVDDDRTYALIEDMFATLREVYETDRVHIGMDEAHHIGLGRFLDRFGYQNRFEILSRHLKRVVEISEKYGFKPMMWSDMFFRILTHNQYYVGDPNMITEEIAKLVPPQVELVYWDYDRDNQQEYENMILAHQRFNNPIWFAGSARKWAGLTPYNELSISRTGKSFNACAKYGVKDVIMTLWGDNGADCSPFAVLPVLFFAAETYRGNTDMQDIKIKFKAMFGVDFDDFCLIDLPTHILNNASVKVNNIDKLMLYNDPVYGIYDILATEFCDAGEKYAQFRDTLKGLQTGEYKYIFDTSAALCDLLSSKFDLGYKVRTAYKNGDKAELEKLLNKIDTVIEKLEVFHSTYYDMWMKERKGNGFDVQDIRLGGLKARLLTCKRKINDYISGKVDVVYEFEEEILPVDTYNPYYDNNWAHTASANII